MRIGIFGGTFDPPHLGHLILAERCRDEAALDQVWFLPSYQPPHKAAGVTRFDQRVDMLALAVVGQPAFAVNPIEKELPPPSYTAETLAELHRRHPTDEFCLLVGADCLPDLPGWYQPQRVVAQAELLVAPRPGVELWDAARLATALGVPAVRLRPVDAPLVEIASRDIRRRVADNRSIRYLTPRAVEAYIAERGLYAPAAGGC